MSCLLTFLFISISCLWYKLQSERDKCTTCVKLYQQVRETG